MKVARIDERRRRVTSDRRIPGWAAGVLTRLARDRPAVLTRPDLAVVLDDAGSARDVDTTARELQRLGWLVPLHLKGVWAYLPPGEDELVDPYIDLRAWLARDEDAVFALCGEAAAWHLGYLGRAGEGTTPIWVPDGLRPPHGLRAHVAVVTLGWGAQDASRLGPTPRLLHKRHLDLTAWASGLPAFGPEALVVQLAARPASFVPWADLVGHLEVLAADCDLGRLAELLGSRSTSAWQRAAYLLERGGRHDAAIELLQERPASRLSTVQYGTGPDSVWSGEFKVVDRLVAPLQQVVGKA